MANVRSSAAAPAQIAVKLAKANGTADPTIEAEYERSGNANTVGGNINIPLRIFDRNQGNKETSKYTAQANRFAEIAARNQVFSDVDSSYATLTSTLNLLQSYKARYLAQASRVRDTISFSYEHGAASLLDFLNAQADYRGVQLNYLNLVGSYMDAASQLNAKVAA